MDKSMNAVLAALTYPLPLATDPGDSRSPGELKHHSLQRRILASYEEQLSGIPSEEMGAWTLRRMAELEAKIVTLQYNMIKIQASHSLRAVAVEAETRTFAEGPTRKTHQSVICDDSMVQGGFHDCEFSANKTPYRWLGREPQAWVLVPAVEGPVEIRLRVSSVYFLSCLESTRVSINDGDWAVAELDGNSDPLNLVARPEIGQGEFNGSFLIRIDTGGSDSPVNHGLDDVRYLSMALNSIEVMTVSTANGTA